MNHDDLTSLRLLNEETVISVLRTRYENRIFYTTAGFALIALNPCRSVPELYSDDVITSYSEDQHGKLPPHIFKIAQKVVQKGSHASGSVNQSIVVSGESGAGKTWTTRNLMRYIAATTSKLSKRRESLALVSSIEQRVLDSNPILEAFGNAVTVCNDNSSRFGKYVQLQLNKRGKVVGANIRTYLLEKVRVVRQRNGETNYHIFNQILLGLPETESRALCLSKLADKMQNDVKARNPSDGHCFSVTTAALTNVGFPIDIQEKIIRLLAGILHLNSIRFEQAMPARTPSRCTPTQEELENVVSCLDISGEILADFFVTSQLVTGKGETINKLCTTSEAEWRRDCLSKTIYERLFRWIVDFINRSICGKTQQWSWFIGLLDVYGFENFRVNSLEQLCINYANERLQQLYVVSFVRAEQEVYLDEGLDWQPIAFTDNRACVDLISSRFGVFSLLDEECRLNRNSSPATLCSRLVSNLSKHRHFVVSGGSNRSSVFGIKHFAAIVHYNTTDFLDKNQDCTPDRMVYIMKCSGNDLLQEVGNEDDVKQTLSAKFSQHRRRTVVSKFKSSLEELMATLRSTSAHYIRCIRPNDSNDATRFDANKAPKFIVHPNSVLPSANCLPWLFCTSKGLMSLKG